LIELKDISLVYSINSVRASRSAIKRKDEVAALQNINAVFEEGQISAIAGPSGCGKTSLIKIMAGLIAPTGAVSVNGNPLQGVRKQTAVIFQDYGLLPWKTVRANAELPLRIKNAASPVERASIRTGRQKVESLLAEFRLASFSNHYPHQLSGGMKQRLAIVRALAAEPEHLLMDEPFSSLDALTREDAQDFLLSVQRERRLTIIMVTHSIEEAVYLADSVYVMNGVNPGSITERIKISREGTHDLFRSSGRFHELCEAVRQSLIKTKKEGETP
jgi:NitT/TauT family transport system ATP-binding protein